MDLGSGDAANIEFTSPDGDQYSGPIKAGKFHGKGKLVYRDGNQYEGDFVENQRCGTGKMTYKDGS